MVGMRAISPLRMLEPCGVLDRAGRRYRKRRTKFLPALGQLVLQLVVGHVTEVLRMAKEISLPLHELRPDGELGAREAKRFPWRVALARPPARTSRGPA